MARQDKIFSCNNHVIFKIFSNWYANTHNQQQICWPEIGQRGTLFSITQLELVTVSEAGAPSIGWTENNNRLMSLIGASDPHPSPKTDSSLTLGYHTAVSERWPHPHRSWNSCYTDSRFPSGRLVSAYLGSALCRPPYNSAAMTKKLVRHKPSLWDWVASVVSLAFSFSLPSLIFMIFIKNVTLLTLVNHWLRPLTHSDLSILTLPGAHFVPSSGGPFLVLQ